MHDSRNIDSLECKSLQVMSLNYKPAPPELDTGIL